MTIWVLIVVSGILVYLSRLSFIELFGRYEIPEGLRRFLRFVPAAVLPAMAMPAVLMTDGSLDITADNIRIYAGVVGAVVAFATKNMLLTIAAGMAMLWTLQWLV